MTGDLNYLLSFLRTLDDLGSTPPMTLLEFLDRVRESDGNVVLIEAILLSDDLLQQQAYLSGELKDIDPTVISEAQIKNDEPLPDFLTTSQTEDDIRNSIDSLWANYYHYALDVAGGRDGSDFLKKWVAFEVGLRNALVVARAKALGIDPHSYIVAGSVGSASDEFNSIISEWVSASNPLEGLKVLDQARWRWIAQNDDWFGYSDDELAAYAAKLMLLKRWKRLSDETSQRV